MSDSKHKSTFWLGNTLLGVALMMLLFLDTLWQNLGSWAMGVWMLLAGGGMYLITKDKGPGSNMPD